MNSNVSIAIVGRGNVGTHLFKALGGDMDERISLIDSRTLDGLTNETDVIILSVTDSSISKVAEAVASKLSSFKGIITHTSGTMGLQLLAPFFDKVGVFYPLQTFNKDIEINNYREIPVFIEANTQNAVNRLMKIALGSFDNVYEMTTEMRGKLHLASVFACNFVNAMYTVADSILSKEGFSFSIVQPLVMQTALKAMDHRPFDCQTGPAVRGDLIVMSHHLKLLENNPTLFEMYRLISGYISHTSKK